MASFRQTSFAGGEIAPGLWGRTDSERYGMSLRTCRNFIVTPHGSLVNRPGTYHLDTLTDINTPKLVPFNGYLLVFGYTHMRVYQVVWPLQGTFFVEEVALPAFLVPHFTWTQMGDVLVLTQFGAPTYRLSYDGTTWTFEEVSYALEDSYFGGGYPLAMEPLPVEDLPNGIVAREWHWMVTALVMHKTTREEYELKGRLVTESRDYGTGVKTAMPAKVPVSTKGPVTITWRYDAPWDGLPYEPAGFADYWVTGFRIYRGRGDVFGFVGQTTTTSFVDEGVEPDFATQPPKGRNPFVFYEPGTTTVLATEYPGTAAFHEQRLVYGGSSGPATSRPAWLFGSKVGDYLSFDNPIPRTADAAFEFELASTMRETVYALVPLDTLLVFTSGGVWTVEGLSSLEAPRAVKHTNEGAATNDGARGLQPLVLGDAVLYVRTNQRSINEIAYEFERSKFGTSDLTFLVQHFFGQGIQSWTYAQDPYRALWMSLIVGERFLSCTYHRQQQMVAWAQHDTPQGAVRYVCALDSSYQHSVFMLVERAGSLRLEVMSPREVGDEWSGGQYEACFLDAAKAFANVSPSAAVTGLTHLEGMEVWAVADGTVVGPLTVSGGAITLPEPATNVQIGLRYDCDLETLDLAGGRQELRGKQKIVRAVSFDVTASRGLWTGETFDDLVEWKQRMVSNSYGTIPVYTGPVDVRVSSSWNLGGRAVLRQKDPLPIAIHGFVRDVEMGGE